jgi:hypothetical protein
MHSAARVFYKYWKYDKDCRPILFIIVIGAMLVPEMSGKCVFEGDLLLLVLDNVSRFAPVHGLRLSIVSRGKHYHVRRWSRFIKRYNIASPIVLPSPNSCLSAISMLCKIQQVARMSTISSTFQPLAGRYRMCHRENKTAKTRFMAFRAPSCMLANNLSFLFCGRVYVVRKMRYRG